MTSIGLIEAVTKLENEIIADKLTQGINGLEWLVMSANVGEAECVSLQQYLNVMNVFKKNIMLLIVDSVNMSPDDFYDKHEINWWITIREALTYLAILKKRNYFSYLELLDQIYEKGRD